MTQRAARQTSSAGIAADDRRDAVSPLFAQLIMTKAVKSAQN